MGDGKDVTSVCAGQDSPVRILIAHYLPDFVGGAERTIADSVENMDPCRIEAIMLAPGEGALAQFYRERGLRVWAEAVQTPRRRFPGLHLSQSALFALRLKKRGVQAVLGNTFPAASRIATAARLAAIPFGIYVREFIADRPRHRSLLARARRIYTISRDLQGYLAEMVDPQKISLLYDYIDPRPILEAAGRHRAGGRRALPVELAANPVVGLIGRITPFKQQDLFLRAVPLVLAQVPAARFVIVGSAREREMEYERSLHELASRLGISQQVSFLGRREDVVEIASELAVSCLTSNREPLGRVILEAHLVGSPVVAANSGGPAEIVDDGRTGLLFPATGPDAAEQLALRIVRLLRDPQLGKSLAGAALQKVHATFASLDTVREQEACILELVQ